MEGDAVNKKAAPGWAAYFRLGLLSVNPLGQPPMFDLVHDQNGNGQKSNEAEEEEAHENVRMNLPIDTGESIR